MTKYTDGSLIRTKQTFGETISEGHTDFGLLDAKGRKLGANWRIFHITVTPVGDAPSDGSIYMESPDLTGERVAVAHTVTRNGERFGGAGCWRSPRRRRIRRRHDQRQERQGARPLRPHGGRHRPRPRRPRPARRRPQREGMSMGSENNPFYEEALDAQRLAADSFA